MTGEPPYANAKVYSLDRMLAAARHDLVVMADSDIRVTPDMLSALAAEFADEKLGLATCPYRVVPGRSFWSTLEAIGLNTEFLGGSAGGTHAGRHEIRARTDHRRAARDAAADRRIRRGKRLPGGRFRARKTGRRARIRRDSLLLRDRAPYRRAVFRRQSAAPSPLEPQCAPFAPLGYLGQVFTHPLPLAVLLCAISPATWPMLAVTAVFRTAAVWATAVYVLHDPLTRRLWWLVPLQDAANLFVWAAGFFGNTILWRGRRYWLLRDGRFEPVR